jgi:hypothetical protein
MPFTPGDNRSIPFTTTQEQQPESFGIPANTAVMAAYFQIIEARLAALESQVASLTTALE